MKEEKVNKNAQDGLTTTETTSEEKKENGGMIPPNQETASKDGKKKKILAAVLSLVIAGGIGVACYVKGQENKKTAQATAFDDVEVAFNEEYSDGAIARTKDGTVDTKELIFVTKDGKEDKDTVVDSVDVAEIDTTEEGDYVVTYTLSTKDKLGNHATKTFEKTFSVVSTDTTAPVIKLKEDTVTLTVGDKLNAKDNVKSVKDEFDGEIKDYTVDDSKVDTSKKGTYKVTVTATDSSDNKAEKEFTVKVKEKKTTASTSNKSSTTASSNKTNASSSKNNTTTTNNNSGTTATVINTTTNTNTNTSSNTASNNNTAAQPQQTCRTVHHDATGHYETVVTGQTWVEVNPAWDETVVTGSVAICNGCYQEFSTYDEWSSHCDYFLLQGNYDHGAYHTRPTFSTVHHDATGHYENVTSQQWVQDSAAYDETVCG